MKGYGGGGGGGGGGAKKKPGATLNDKVVQINAKTVRQVTKKLRGQAVWLLFFHGRCEESACTQHTAQATKALNALSESLAGIVKIGAVDCVKTPQLCKTMQISSLPSLKVLSPETDAFKGQEDYTEGIDGKFTAKDIDAFALRRLPGHLITPIETPKQAKATADHCDTHDAIQGCVVLLTSKDSTPAIIKALAGDFHGKLKFAQVSRGNKKLSKAFGITKFPTVLFLKKAGSKADSPVVYSGKIKHKEIHAFLTEEMEGKKKAKQPESRDFPEFDEL